MALKMLVNAVQSEEVRVAIVNQGQLEDFDLERPEVEKNRGNIYKAVVAAVEPALNAAFIDYGADKQGFLTAHDVDPKIAGLDSDKVYRIDELLKPKQKILVQITKDEVGAKGAVLTTYLSLAGRYVVLMPGSQRQGVSRKVQDDDARRKMKEAASKLDVPDDMGVIIRTAGRDRNKLDLNRDLSVLMRLWKNIKKESNRKKAPALMFKEQDMIIRALRDYFTADIDEIIFDSDDAYDQASEYMSMVMPNQQYVLTRYVERRPIFHHYRIEEQLESLHERKVEMKSGGSIVIEPTEALVSVDVNSGKQKLGGQAQTALETNLEAAREVARQLKLRDLGGIIVVDFIDMASRKHEQRVERAFKDAVRRDRARIKVGRISPNGTLELTRQRIGSALAKSMFQTCTHCDGRGRVLQPEADAISVLRQLGDRAARSDLRSASVRMEARAADLLRTERWSSIRDLEQRFNIQIDIHPDRSYQAGQREFSYETDPNATPIELAEPDWGPAWRPEEVIEEEHLAANDDEDIQDESDTGVDTTSPTEPFGMPSFELLSPEAAGIGNKKPRRKRRRRKKGGSEKSSGSEAFVMMSAEEALRPKSGGTSNAKKKRPNRRGKSSSKKKPEAVKEVPTPVVTPVVETAAPKRSFFARLFRRK